MRNLRLTTPYMHGQHIKDLQDRDNHIVERRLQKRLSQLTVDGVYGPDTDSQTRQILYLLGVGGGVVHGDIKPWMQRLIQHPGLRSPQQRGRSSQRIHEFLSHKDTKSAVLDWCNSKVGITESPANSNRGIEISAWQRDFGIDGEPWCGAFVGFGLKHYAGLPIPNGVVYTPNIINYARSGQGGFASWHSSWSERQAGDLVLFKWPGVSSASCDHVGILDTDRTHTIEGNTSSGDSGSQNNGGGVYRRDRGNTYVVGYARPRY